MTLKRDKKREMARKQLMEKEQETTHSLVSKFSKEMINLIQEKELALLVSCIHLCSVLLLIEKQKFFTFNDFMYMKINQLLRYYLKSVFIYSNKIEANSMILRK